MKYKTFVGTILLGIINITVSAHSVAQGSGSFQEFRVDTANIKSLSQDALVVKPCATCDLEVFNIMKNAKFFHHVSPISNIQLRAVVFSKEYPYISIFKYPNGHDIYRIRVGSIEGYIPSRLQE